MAQLLNRSTRRISLTEAGELYFQRCRQLLADLEELELTVSSLSQTPRGTLRINAPTSFAVLHLAPAIVDFLHAMPDVAVELTLNDYFVDVIHEGFDLVIRITGQERDKLGARKLSSTRMVVCASPDYVQRYGAPVTPEQLNTHRCLSYAYWSTRDEWRFQGPTQSHAVHVSGILKVNNGDVLRTAAIAGLGIVLLPTFIVSDDLRAGRLVRILDQYRLPDLIIYALYPHSHQPPAKVSSFLKFLAERFTDPAPWDR